MPNSAGVQSGMGFFPEQLRDVPKGATRAVLVLTLASLVSWGAGEVVDWVQEKIEGPQAKEQSGDDLAQLLKAAGLAQP